MSRPPHFHFITLFPQTIEVWLTTSILGRAREKGLFQFSLIQLRDFAIGKHRSVDDVAYGGGGGMVLRLEPLVAALESVLEKLQRETTRVIVLSPAGRKIEQTLIDEIKPASGIADYVFVCGHYEGVDQRFIEGWVDLEVSLGDFVITGGELPAVALTDSLIRTIDGALGNRAEASLEESFSLSDAELGALVEYPQYTRPPAFRGREVPPVLLGGDHGAIARWRKEQSIHRTKNRP